MVTCCLLVLSTLYSDSFTRTRGTGRGPYFPYVHKDVQDYTPVSYILCLPPDSMWNPTSLRRCKLPKYLSQLSGPSVRDHNPVVLRGLSTNLGLTRSQIRQPVRSVGFHPGGPWVLDCTQISQVSGDHDSCT